jgi:hypothetical protein
MSRTYSDEQMDAAAARSQARAQAASERLLRLLTNHHPDKRKAPASQQGPSISATNPVTRVSDSKEQHHEITPPSFTNQ